ncbi:unnamed protein product [Mycena citricolor]|uniref:Uncharacterized protein n=1 Tax=Mycena citricolor TaxID=2018698 RepID=A0AAD2GTS6_9AGAR|nr:unnamed protein product [Mycena citricolor]
MLLSRAWRKGLNPGLSYRPSRPVCLHPFSTTPIPDHDAGKERRNPILVDPPPPGLHSTASQHLRPHIDPFVQHGLDVDSDPDALTELLDLNFQPIPSPAPVPHFTSSAEIPVLPQVSKDERNGLDTFDFSSRHAARLEDHPQVPDASTKQENAVKLSAYSKDEHLHPSSFHSFEQPQRRYRSERPSSEPVLQRPQRRLVYLKPNSNLLGQERKVLETFLTKADGVEGWHEYDENPGASKYFAVLFRESRDAKRALFHWKWLNKRQALGKAQAGGRSLFLSHTPRAVTAHHLLTSAVGLNSTALGLEIEYGTERDALSAYNRRGSLPVDFLGALQSRQISKSSALQTPVSRMDASIIALLRLQAAPSQSLIPSTLGNIDELSDDALLDTLFKLVLDADPDYMPLDTDTVRELGILAAKRSVIPVTVTAVRTVFWKAPDAKESFDYLKMMNDLIELRCKFVSDDPEEWLSSVYRQGFCQGIELSRPKPSGTTDTTQLFKTLFASQHPVGDSDSEDLAPRRQPQLREENDIFRHAQDLVVTAMAEKGRTLSTGSGLLQLRGYLKQRHVSHDPTQLAVYLHAADPSNVHRMFDVCEQLSDDQLHKAWITAVMHFLFDRGQYPAVVYLFRLAFNSSKTPTRAIEIAQSFLALHPEFEGDTLTSEKEWLAPETAISLLMRTLIEMDPQPTSISQLLDDCLDGKMDSPPIYLSVFEAFVDVLAKAGLRTELDRLMMRGQDLLSKSDFDILACRVFAVSGRISSAYDCLESLRSSASGEQFERALRSMPSNRMLDIYRALILPKTTSGKQFSHADVPIALDLIDHLKLSAVWANDREALYDLVSYGFLRAKAYGIKSALSRHRQEIQVLREPEPTTDYTPAAWMPHILALIQEKDSDLVKPLQMLDEHSEELSIDDWAAVLREMVSLKSLLGAFAVEEKILAMWNPAVHTEADLMMIINPSRELWLKSGQAQRFLGAKPALIEYLTTQSGALGTQLRVWQNANAAERTASET